MNSSSSHKQFADVLGTALHLVKVQEGKNLGIIQDELGFAIGRNGASFIDYLRRGNIPSKYGDLESLAYELVHRGGLDKDRCWKFLNYGGHPEPNPLLSEWFPSENRNGYQVIMEPGPLIVGPPVKHPKYFFGRERVLQQIFNYWRFAPLQNIALIGPRRSGKTSLLYHLVQISKAKPERLREGQWQVSSQTAEKFRWIFIDFQDSRMSRLHRLLTFILQGLDLKVPDPCTLNNFMDTIEGSRFRRPTIIVMDAVDIGLAAPELDQNFWWNLCSLVSNYGNGNIAFLVATHKSSNSLTTNQRQSHPFFNLFNSIELGPFQEVEARDFIRSLPYEFSSNDIEWILANSKLCRCYYKYFANEGFMHLKLVKPISFGERSVSE